MYKFQCPSAFSVDCDEKWIAGRTTEMKFQCPSAFSVDCDYSSRTGSRRICASFNAHRHSPSIATRSKPVSENEPTTFQCPSAFSVDCDHETVFRTVVDHHVSMPIGILRRLRPCSARSGRTRPCWFQCPSAFSVDCDGAGHAQAVLPAYVSMPIGILRRLRRPGTDPIEIQCAAFQCPSAFSVDCDVCIGPPTGPIWIRFQCPSAFSVDCDYYFVDLVDTREAFQCPSAFSVDCDDLGSAIEASLQHRFNAHRHSPSIATTWPRQPRR